MEEKNLEGNKSISFEDALTKLELIVKQLEKGELSLEDLLEKYSEGVALSRFCLAKLNSAEQQIDKILQQEQGKLIEKPLTLQGEENAETVLQR